jgi:hypothetical protein
VSEIDDLIESNKQLLSGFSKPAKKSRANVNDDIFIYQNRPVTYTDWAKARDVVFVSVYYPTEIPIFDSARSVTLHNHTVFERCTADRYCHRSDYEVEDRHRSGFMAVWGYLYNPEVSPVVQVRLNLDL